MSNARTLEWKKGWTFQVYVADELEACGNLGCGFDALLVRRKSTLWLHHLEHGEATTTSGDFDDEGKTGDVHEHFESGLSGKMPCGKYLGTC
jgi:hypothetical protein